MTQTPEGRRRLSRRLGLQMAFLLALVLAPFAMISILQMTLLVQESRARSEAALLGDTMRAVSKELRIIRESSGAAFALAAAVRRDPTDLNACRSIMRSLVRTDTRYVFAGFVPPDGVIRCGSTEGPIDVSQDPFFQQNVDALQPQVAINRNARLADEPILAMTEPVIDSAGAVLGYVLVSVPRSALEPAQGDARPLDLVTFTADGEILYAATAPEQTAEGLLPENRALGALAGGEPVAFSARDADGRQRVYSVIPIIPDEIYALGARLLADDTHWLDSWRATLPALLPAAMWLVSLIVAFLAADRLVIRNINKLSGAFAAFAGGSREIREIDMTKAPAEMQDIAASFTSMAESITRDEAELEDTIHQREVLLREVHHRVKNNLQLIASIMNMQMRRVGTSAERQMLKGLQDRVLSLASVHKELFQTSGLADVRMDELLSSITAHMERLSDEDGRPYVIAHELAPIRMTPDQAVPLALLATEALNKAMRHTSLSADGTRRVVLELRRAADNHAVLSVENAFDPDEHHEEPPAEGLSAQLIRGFASQLQGKVSRDGAAGTYRLSVSFEVKALAEGEERAPTA
ncbi:sensor histidine kinase [Actibacterium ureilyticum]|uniref:sensor histidine kinase n=1 Tax=Actibacterium ureilyticum TaxID=1590614 RepID=UPI000BAABA49|nr:sensor histidine kinase [Actibacterium ureilyticum]